MLPHISRRTKILSVILSSLSIPVFISQLLGDSDAYLYIIYIVSYSIGVTGTLTMMIVLTKARKHQHPINPTKLIAQSSTFRAIVARVHMRCR